MGSNVFANGREISAKKDSNKSIAGMPDVCLSPPSPPAGPVPIPYPNFSKASDTDSGTKKVLIGGKEAGLKNKSDYKQSKGNEAATRGFGMGTVTHKLQGKTKHAAWSSDVKFEGLNVIRNLDMTTHNHGSGPNTGALTVDVASMVAAGKMEEACQALNNKNDAKRRESGQQDAKSTITHGTYTTPAPDAVTAEVAACSRVLAQKYSNGMAQGLQRTQVGTGTFKKGPNKGKEYKKMESEKTKVACEEAKEKKFGYRSRRSRPHTSHTESRIIEEIFAARGPKPGGTLLLNIDWKTTKKTGYARLTAR